MKHAVACICLLLAGSLRAQESLTTETIIKLARAGIGEDIIVGMVNQQPGKYALSADDMIALKKAGATDKLIAAMLVRNGASSGQPVPSGASGFATNAVVTPAANPGTLILHDATPIRLRLKRNLSSENARAGDAVEFEVLDDLRVDDVLVVARGGTALATITEAEPKKWMTRSGKLGVNIDYVRLVNGDKVAVRAVKEAKAGGHTDATIPRGTEMTALVDGEIKLDRTRLAAGVSPESPTTAASPATASRIALPSLTPASMFDVTFTSTPSNALVTMSGQPIGRTPFTTRLGPGSYKAAFSVDGYATSTKDVPVGNGFPTTVSTALRALP
ncbi:MAG TPA: PEGA domain-containing protein [Bryobacteraceae bacterium]|jgi:hypothetical protein|nr:PEGA domain-containing protein [Bryobacteraceae bacterium]